MNPHLGPNSACTTARSFGADQSKDIITSDNEELCDTSLEYSLFGNLIDNAEMTINLFKLTPEEPVKKNALCDDDTAFFRQLTKLREQRSSRLEQQISQEWISFEDVQPLLNQANAHKSDPGVTFSHHSNFIFANDKEANSNLA